MVAPRDRTGPTPKYSLILSPAVLAGRDEDLSITSVHAGRCVRHRNSRH